MAITGTGTGATGVDDCGVLATKEWLSPEGAADEDAAECALDVGDVSVSCEPKLPISPRAKSPPTMPSPYFFLDPDRDVASVVFLLGRAPVAARGRVCVSSQPIPGSPARPRPQP